MSEATDVVFYGHLQRSVKCKDGTYRDSLQGYLTYKGSPIYKLSGWRNDDKKGVSKKDGKPYHIKSYTLSVYEGENTSDPEFKRPEKVTLTLADKVRRSDNAPFQTLKTDQVYNVETKKARRGLPIPGTNMVVQLQGTVPDRTVGIVKAGEPVEVHPIKLEVNEYALATMSKDFGKPKEERVGYTMSSPDALMSDDMLASLKEQFKYFEPFMQTFDSSYIGAGAKDQGGKY